MYYEINVAKNGKHFFATAERSITTSLELADVYSALSKAFTKDDGYTMSVTQWKSVGTFIKEEEIV